MEITTDRLSLRSFDLDDIEPFCKMHGDFEVMRYLGGTLTQRESEQEIRKIIEIEKKTGLVRLAVELKSSPGLIGYCGLKPAGEFTDLSYMISKDHWGVGYALEAAQRVRKFGLTDLSIANMEAGGAAANVASIKILEHLDFNHREELIFNNRPAIRFFD